MLDWIAKMDGWSFAFYLLIAIGVFWIACLLIDWLSTGIDELWNEE